MCRWLSAISIAALPTLSQLRIGVKDAGRPSATVDDTPPNLLELLLPRPLRGRLTALRFLWDTHSEFRVNSPSRTQQFKVIRQFTHLTQLDLGYSEFSPTDFAALFGGEDSESMRRPPQ